jgi:DNA-binding beta-propeller fold protein YncE
LRRTTDIDKDADYTVHPGVDDKQGPLPLVAFAPFVQPRAIVYRKAKSSLLVASEGGDAIVELDALAIEPALQPLATHSVRQGNIEGIDAAATGGAPSGIALSADEREAYVFCRSTYDVVAVDLERAAGDASKLRVRHIADDPLLDGVGDKDPVRKFREAARIGRRLFYNATDEATSGGLAP